ncbi:MAG TPA: DUF1684 domain-containing protein [Candidatus Saccharimonadales bacterium]|jgi:uncharacterized protein (DUF1684 family)|nr:DUF1684 domain-containing protein [Candidatus Saccharimonadales bacterium]
MRSIPERFVTSWLVVLALLAAAISPYQQSVEKWRQDYEATLKSDDGWLTVAGLFWLHEGENRFGSGPWNDIVLPGGTAPAVAGHFDLHAGKAVVHVNPGVPITMNGKTVEEVELPADSRQHRLVMGDLVLYVHASGERLAIRMKDKNSRLRKEFAGLHWYPVNEAYRFQARYVPYGSLRPVQIQNVLGDTEKISMAGYISFQLNGQEYRLDAEKKDSGSLFIVFRDLTSSKDTYAAARFLDTDPPMKGVVEVDFNKAYNPPCAYNPFTTCPLPSPGNRLRVEIPAGEKRYH